MLCPVGVLGGKEKRRKRRKRERLKRRKEGAGTSVGAQLGGIEEEVASVK